MKRNIFNIGFYLMIFLFAVFFTACKKDWLNAKPDQSFVVPKTLNDVQALLNNGTLSGMEPDLGELGSDDYTIRDSDIQLMYFSDKNAYEWNSDILGAEGTICWDRPYSNILYANVALETLEKIDVNEDNKMYWNKMKATALFYRCWSFYTLSQIFAKSYNAATAKTDLGIPLRLSSNINLKIGRATLQETYDRIIMDLKEAALLFPSGKLIRNRVSQEAIYGLLARVYLSMQDYNQCFINADACLRLYNTLIDYNTLDPSLTYPFPPLNDEVIFDKTIVGSGTFIDLSCVENDLFKSYAVNDLRSKLFFKEASDGNYSFRGSYFGGFIFFSGIAVDEMYLTRAECYARNNNVNAAMKDLNDLLRTRWARKPGTQESSFTDLTAIDADDALRKILTERRKELLMRGLRWTDLRRLNTDPRFAKTLTRTVNGQTYTLPPNSNRYVYPIPNDEIRYSGIEQNIRN